jgi:NTE family protein
MPGNLLHRRYNLPHASVTVRVVNSDPGVSIGLILGAGGPTGGPFIHAALEELERVSGWSGHTAKTIVGTSAGAFVAASLQHTNGETSLAHFRELARLENAAGLRPGLRHRLATVVRRVAGSAVAAVAPRGRPIAEYRVPSGPYHPGAEVVTVERFFGKRVRHSLIHSPDPESAIRASAAIPGLNAPIDLGGKLHVDGAVHSAANADTISPDDHDALVVIAPMITASGGSLVGRFHRAQLRFELRRWVAHGKPAIVIMPNLEEHRVRRDRPSFEQAGRRAVTRLVASRDES